MSKPVRCAIYTRKSSDEGLDQSFNSLDAQREAGEAYVRSQASEGWSAISTHYNDGGFSGGTLERPALQRLLADIEQGRIDVVVVYKIDRLTRSLSDFSRIVEVFEKAGTSFVSVTQSFNTTNSMGRLMLNVLLSFAQFEREVTGERIRDKIAASKAKGMWMGGTLPLGYDLPAPGTRTLLVNDEEAKIVRQIFARYCELGSVHALQRELVEQGIRSKIRTTASGKILGGQSFSRGALFHLLRNRTYLGQIVHRDKAYPGEHRAIVDEALFNQAELKLNANARRDGGATKHQVRKAPLAGKLFDATGEPMSPTFSRGASGRIYRYYVSTALQQGRSAGKSKVLQRIAAPSFERFLTERLERWLGTQERPLDRLRTVRLEPHAVLIELSAKNVDDFSSYLTPKEQIVLSSRRLLRVRVAVSLPLRGGSRSIVFGAKMPTTPDPTLIAALRKAHRMVSRERGQPLVTEAPASQYDRMILRLAFLAPDIQRDILAGQQPDTLSLEKLKKIEIPLAWQQQRLLLGWPSLI